jgi:hypothetical protein
MQDNNFERWLPLRFEFDRTGVAVRWINFSRQSLSEPFFAQTIRHLRSTVPAANERLTNLSEMLEKAASVPSTLPAGVIFHVSRCGSTLVANAMKSGGDCVVLSESRPVGMLLQPGLFENSLFPPEGHEAARKLLMEAVINLYSSAFGEKVIIKCQSAVLLHLSLARSIWPTVPFLILIRDPVEVMVSNLAKPAGWVRSMHRASDSKAFFGLTHSQIQKMSIEEYCAHGLGEFFRATIQATDENCRIVDYEQLDFTLIDQIAQWFGVRSVNKESSNLHEELRIYAKDPNRRIIFEDDRERKQKEASNSVRALAKLHAQKPYETLKEIAEAEFAFPTQH